MDKISLKNHDIPKLFLKYIYPFDQDLWHPLIYKIYKIKIIIEMSKMLRSLVLNTKIYN